MEDRLQRVIADVLEVSVEEITDEASPETLHTWDSLNHLNLIMAIEAEFGVVLSAEDAVSMLSVELVKTVLRKHGVDV